MSLRRLAFVLLACPALLVAQSPAESPAAPGASATPSVGGLDDTAGPRLGGRACRPDVGPADSARVIVYAAVTAPKGQRALTWSQAEPLLEVLISAFQRDLPPPSAETGLPAGDATIAGWIDRTELTFTVLPDGSVRGFTAGRAQDRARVAPLANGLLAAGSAGVFAKAMEGTRDSLRATFSILVSEWPSIGGGTSREKMPPMSAPLMTLTLPRERPVRKVGGPRARYPESARKGNMTGNVLVQFVVDTAGAVVPSTIREMRNAVTLPSDPDLLRVYELFVASVMDVIPRQRYSPMESGGCRVGQLVQQPYTFHLSR